MPLYEATKILFADRKWDGQFTEIWTINFLELGTVLLLLIGVGLGLVGPWRVRHDQLVLPFFGLALALFMISFPSVYKNYIPYPLYTSSRIGLEVFPAFMMLGRFGRHPLVDRLLLALFLTMQGILVARFLHGGWVA